MCVCVTRESSGTYVPSPGNIHDNRSPLKSDVDERARWRVRACVEPGFRLFGRIIVEDVTTDATTSVWRGKPQRVSLSKREIYLVSPFELVFSFFFFFFFGWGWKILVTKYRNNWTANTCVRYVWNLKTLGPVYEELAEFETINLKKNFGNVNFENVACTLHVEEAANENAETKLQRHVP